MTTDLSERLLSLLLLALCRSRLRSLEDGHAGKDHGGHFGTTGAAFSRISDDSCNLKTASRSRWPEIQLSISNRRSVVFETAVLPLD